MTPNRRQAAAYPAVPHGRRPSDFGPRDEEWEIAICGDLTDKQIELEERLVSVPRKSHGTIFFDSCGGSAFVGLALASLIRLRGLQAIGVVAGECSSAAVMPFAACKERYVTQHSSLLFHPIRWQSEEQVRLEEAAEWARHFAEMERDHDSLLAGLFNCPEEVLARWNRPGRFVNGREIVEAGLAKMIDLFAGDIWTQTAEMHPE